LLHATGWQLSYAWDAGHAGGLLGKFDATLACQATRRWVSSFSESGSSAALGRVTGCERGVLDLDGLSAKLLDSEKQKYYKKHCYYI
jgi:hypothetical protein